MCFFFWGIQQADAARKERERVDRTRRRRSRPPPPRKKGQREGTIGPRVDTILQY